MNNESLVLDLLEWIAARPRTHGDVMKTWRTSCPKLPIWEDAVDAEFVTQDGANVGLSRRGADYLCRNRHASDVKRQEPTIRRPR